MRSPVNICTGLQKDEGNLPETLWGEIMANLFFNQGHPPPPKKQSILYLAIFTEPDGSMTTFAASWDPALVLKAVKHEYLDRLKQEDPVTNVIQRNDEVLHFETPDGICQIMVCDNCQPLIRG